MLKFSDFSTATSDDYKQSTFLFTPAKFCHFLLTLEGTLQMRIFYFQFLLLCQRHKVRIHIKHQVNLYF